MKGLEVVLVATDLSAAAEHALERAAVIAQRHQARLEIVHVGRAPSSHAWWAASGSEDADANATNASDSSPPGLDAHCERLRRDRGIDAAVTLRRGSVAACVCSRAEETAADLIVLGATGRGRIGRRVLGSTAQSVVRLAAVPVLVVRLEGSHAYRRVLAATDFSKAATAAARAGLTLAPDAAALFFTALDAPTGEEHPFFGLGDEERARRLHEAKESARGRLRELAGRLGHDDASLLVREGRPDHELPAVVQEVEAELVCLGGRGHSGVERLVMGSTSAHAIAELSCDVLVVPVRPRG